VQSWSLVVPAKLLSRAKTRLAPLTAGSGDRAPARHRELVLAMLADTVAAALASPAVAGLLVVTDDLVVGDLVRSLGARTVPDTPDAGLNAALTHGAAAARAAGAGGVAAMSSDLPALRPTELTAALAAAAATGRSAVADAEGTGTTLLCAATGQLDPHFGPGSAAAHRRSGAVLLTGDWPGLRRDVDTAADLDTAAALGVGPRTARLLADVPWSPG